MADDRYRQDYRQQSQEDRYHQQHPQGAQHHSQYPPPPGENRPSDDPRSSMAASVSLPSMHDPRLRATALRPTGKAMPIRLTLATLARPARRMATRLHRASSRVQEVTYLLFSSLILALEVTAPLSTTAPAEAHPQPTLSRRTPSTSIRIPTTIDSNLSRHLDTPMRTLIPRRKGLTPRVRPARRTSDGAGCSPSEDVDCLQVLPQAQDPLQRLSECSWGQVPELCEDEPGMRIPTRVLVQLDGFHPCICCSWRRAPGTPLYGAYGQPLAPQAHPYPPGAPQQQQQQPPPGPYYQHPPQGPPPHHQAPPGHPPQGVHAHQGPPAQSPAESSYSYTSATRTEEGSQTGRRRRRSSEDQEESYRLPPPRVGATEEEPRRRSPAEFSSRSSPGGLGLPPFSSRQSPRNPTLPQLATPNQPQPGQDGRSPVQRVPSGGSTPAHQGQPASQTPTQQPAQQAGRPQQQQGKQSVMSLSNLMDSNNSKIDEGMLAKLNNRPKDTKPSQ